MTTHDQNIEATPSPEEVEPALALPDPRKPATDPDAKRTAALVELLTNWSTRKPSALMTAALRDDNARTPRADAGRAKIGLGFEERVA